MSYLTHEDRELLESHAGTVSVAMTLGFYDPAEPHELLEPCGTFLPTVEHFAKMRELIASAFECNKRNGLCLGIFPWSESV